MEPVKKEAARNVEKVRTLDEPAHGELAEIAPGLWRVVLPVPFPPGGVGVLVLEDQIDGRAGWTIVDTGLQSARDAWLKLLDGPLRGRPVLRVIATHHHPDHIGLAGWFQTEFGAQLWTTRTAWLYARMLQMDAPATSYPEVERFFVRCGYDAEQLERARLRAKIGFAVTVAKLPPGFHQIAEGDSVTIGDRRWRIHIGHGHAPDHALLSCSEDRLLIAGDQILPRISPNIGVYPTEPDGDPLGAWLESSRRLGEIFDDECLVLPGHGAPFYGARTRLQEVVHGHEVQLRALEAFLETERRVIDCFPALYRRRITESAEGLATVETLAHLNHLMRTDRAARRLSEEGVYFWRRASTTVDQG